MAVSLVETCVPSTYTYRCGMVTLVAPLMSTLRMMLPLPLEESPISLSGWLEMLVISAAVVLYTPSPPGVTMVSMRLFISSQFLVRLPLP